jgi:hypothetical protein
MAWSIFPATVLETTQAQVWQEANRRHQQSHPLLDLKFVGPLLRHFGNPGVRLAIEMNGAEPLSAVLFERARPGVWQLFLPSQAQIAPAVFGVTNNKAEQDARFGAWFESLPGYGVVIGLQNQDTAFSGVAQGAYAGMDILPHARTVGITLDTDFDLYWKGRSVKLRENMARQLRNLERAGLTPRLVTRRQHMEMAAAVAAHGDLESGGWKAGQGTAIHCDNAQGRFYTEVLERFADDGRVRAFQLFFNDTLAASQFAIEQNGMMVLLKTAHREEYSRHSPGRMLDYFMLKELFAERRLRVVEFYTNASQGDSRWATFSRDIVHVNVYRSAFARRALNAVRSWRRRATGGHKKSVTASSGT